MKPTRLVSLTTLILASLAVLHAADTPKLTIKPNVVFILADDLGVNDLSLYGSKFFETPNIDALARRGMKFNQAYSASPLCSPTRSSILTGLYPARIGITAPECHLPKEVLDKHLVATAPPRQKALTAESVTRLQTNYYTLAEAFKADGYTTAHFGKWHLGPEPFSPLLEKNVTARAEIFCHFPHSQARGEYERMPAPTPATPASSVRQGDWKLIRFYCDNPDQSDRHELYNLADDPGERRDLASAQPDRVKQLAARLDQFLKDTSAVVPKPNPAYNPAAMPSKAKPAGSQKNQAAVAPKKSL